MRNKCWNVSNRKIDTSKTMPTERRNKTKWEISAFADTNQMTKRQIVLSLFVSFYLFVWSMRRSHSTSFAHFNLFWWSAVPSHRKHTKSTLYCLKNIHFLSHFVWSDFLACSHWLAHIAHIDRTHLVSLTGNRLFDSFWFEVVSFLVSMRSIRDVAFEEPKKKTLRRGNDDDNSDDVGNIEKEEGNSDKNKCNNSQHDIEMMPHWHAPKRTNAANVLPAKQHKHRHKTHPKCLKNSLEIWCLLLSKFIAIFDFSSEVVNSQPISVIKEIHRAVSDDFLVHWVFAFVSINCDNQFTLINMRKWTVPIRIPWRKGWKRKRPICFDFFFFQSIY